MSNDPIWNADMATLGRWLRQGLNWWIGELAALVPERWREHGRQPRLVALYRSSGDFAFLRNGQPVVLPAVRGPRMIDLALPPSMCLIREVGVPTMGAADLRSFARLDAERLLPLPARDLLVDAAIRHRIAGAGRMTARIAALPRIVVDDVLAAAAAAHIQPGRIGVIDEADPRRIDFDVAPVLRAEGRIKPLSREVPIWWGLVALAFVLNVGLLVLRDHQSVGRLGAIVDAQAPAVSIGRVIAQRVERADTIRAATVARRARHDALGDLAAATAAIPDTAWTQRYTWDGASLRLAGYKQPNADIIAALRRAPRFINVRATNADVVGDIPIGQPFDISLNLRGPRR